MTKHLPIRLVAAAALAAVSLPITVLAAESQTRGIEEVIVTAQRQEEGLQDVPISVSAFTGSMMEDKQIITPSDLQMNAPNVSFTPTNFGGSSFSIRGIGSLVISTTGEAGVSFHMNEISVPTLLNATEFYDIERVEVLRGPQGTLFGRNATGGAINMVTRMPTFDDMDGFVDAEYGDYDNRRLKGAFNLPVTDNLAFRVAGMMLERDGYTDNVAGGLGLAGVDDELDGRDLHTYRITGLWSPTDRSRLWLQYSRFDEDDDRARITNQVCKKNALPTTGCEPDGFAFEQPHAGSTTGGIFGGLVGAVPLGLADPVSDFPRPTNLDFRKQHTDFDPVYQYEEDLFSFGASYDFDLFNVSLSGAYLESEYLSRQDYQMNVGFQLNPTVQNPSGLWPTSEPAGRAGDDWRGGPCNLNDGTAGVEGGCILPVDQTRVFAYDQSDSEAEYWTIEGKFASDFDGIFNFVVGASAYDSETNGDYYVLANTLDLVTDYGVAGLGFPPLYPGFFNNTSDPSGGTLQDGVAVFGETYFQITDAIKLTAGLRYNEDNKEVNDTSVLFNAVDINALVGGVLGADPVWTRLTNFMFGATLPAEQALAELYGAGDQFAAAAVTAPLSAERFAVSAAVPLVPQFGETRALTGSPSDDTWDEFSGRLGVDWALSDSTMVYAFFSRGYKPGGFNPAIPPQFQATSAFTFDAEEVDAFEIGTKNVFLDGSLVVNGSVFTYDYKGLQVTRIANNSSLNDNIDADIMGLELETFWRPDFAPNLQLDMAYSWLDTEVQGSESVDPVNRTAGNPDWILLENFDPGSLTGVNYIAPTADVLPLVNAALTAPVPGALSELNGRTQPGVTYPNGIPAYFSRSFLDANGVTTSDGLPTDLDGKSLPNSPEHTIHLGAAYTFGLNLGNLTFRYDYYWQDDSFAREFNSVGDQIDSWDQHNASAIFESVDGHWVVKAWVRNIADDDNVTGKYLTSDTSGFFRNYFLTEPRLFGASVRYNLNGG